MIYIGFWLFLIIYIYSFIKIGSITRVLARRCGQIFWGFCNFVGWAGGWLLLAAAAAAAAAAVAAASRCCFYLQPAQSYTPAPAWAPPAPHHELRVHPGLGSKCILTWAGLANLLVLQLHPGPNPTRDTLKNWHETRHHNEPRTRHRQEPGTCHHHELGAHKSMGARINRCQNMGRTTSRGSWHIKRKHNPPPPPWAPLVSWPGLSLKRCPCSRCILAWNQHATLARLARLHLQPALSYIVHRSTSSVCTRAWATTESRPDLNLQSCLCSSCILTWAEPAKLPVLQLHLTWTEHADLTPL